MTLYQPMTAFAVIVFHKPISVFHKHLEWKTAGQRCPDLGNYSVSKFQTKPLKPT